MACSSIVRDTLDEGKRKATQMTKIWESATLTAEQAHRLLGDRVISRGGFYAAIKRNEVPHLRLGKRILIPRVAFENWLQSASLTGGRAA
jgi:excisionase family DNA binding protein